MKILIVSHYWLPENGVPQRRWDWLSGLLAAADHEMLVLAPPPHYERKISLKDWWTQKGFRAASKAEPFAPNIEILRTGYFPSGNSISQKALNQFGVAISTLIEGLRIRSTSSQFKPDLIIGTVPAIPSGFIAQLIALKNHVPYVIDLRDAWPNALDEIERWNIGVGAPSWRERVVRRGPGKLFKVVIRASINSVLKNADLILVTSRRLKDDLEERFGSRNDRAATVSLVRNVFPPQSLITNSELHNVPPKSELNVLYAGTVGRAQNLSNAISAARAASDMGVKVRFKIVGSGAAKAKLKKQAAELRVDVDFEPRRPAEDLSDLYEWADTALVHLTDWDSLELAIPSKTYELMLNRVHISAVVAGETADVVNQLGAGHVVPPEDPEALANLWLALCQDPSLMSIGESGQDWVRKQALRDAPTEFLRAIETLDRVDK